MLSARGIIIEQEEGPAFVPEPCQKLVERERQGTGRTQGQGGGVMGQPSQKLTRSCRPSKPELLRPFASEKRQPKGCRGQMSSCPQKTDPAGPERRWSTRFSVSVLGPRVLNFDRLGAKRPVSTRSGSP